MTEVCFRECTQPSNLIKTDIKEQNIIWDVDPWYTQIKWT